METAVSYHALIGEVAKASPRGLKVVKEKGGLKIAR